MIHLSQPRLWTNRRTQGHPASPAADHQGTASGTTRTASAVVIAVTASERGAGATTLAVHLASVLTAPNRAVMLGDALGSAGLQAWAQRRSPRVPALGLSVGVLPLSALMAIGRRIRPRADGPPSSWLVIDLPTGGGRHLSHALWPDLLLLAIPGAARRATVAVGKAMLTDRLAGRQRRAVVTQLDAGTPLPEDARPSFDRAKLDVLPTALHHHPEIADAMAAGLSVGEIHPDGDADQEVRALARMALTLLQPAPPVVV